MFQCQSCIRRCLRFLDAELASHHPRIVLQSTCRPPRLYWRGITTHAAPPATRSSRDTALAQQPSKWKGSSQAQSRKRKAYELARRDPVKKEIDPNERRVKENLKYMTDALKLADTVRFMLRDSEEVDNAFALVRAASSRMQCVVSWNHLIDYQMGKSKVNAALKTYNEMKKRAQTPDSHTYLLILRGLAEHAHYSQTVGKALSLYHSMCTPTAKVKPSIIHTNAVLKVCARAGDMDALWGIASKIPERGPGAADNLTFTTILNAIREQAEMYAPQGLSSEESAGRREQAIVEGRRIWEDVVGRWRQGELWIDEALVCAMGRLLLIGARPRDWDDVLSLVQQTMDIPRLVPRLGSEARQRMPVPRIRAPHTPDNMKNDASEIEGDEPRPGGEFDNLPTNRRVGSELRSTSLAHAKPSRNTLSLVLDSCLKMAAKAPATQYWQLFTGSLRIAPDLDNIHMYMRLLRLSRSSADALVLLREDFPAFGHNPLPKSFRIAMSTCVRDKNNPNVMDTAGKIVDLMQNALSEVDLRTMGMYLELAISTGKGANMARALQRFLPENFALKSFYNSGNVRRRDAGDDEHREEVLQLLRRMVHAYERVLETGAVPDGQDAAEWRRARSKLAGLLSRASGKNTTDRERMEEKMASTREHLVRRDKQRRRRFKGQVVQDWEKVDENDVAGDDELAIASGR